MKIAVFMNDLNSGGAEKMMVGFLNYTASQNNDEIILILARQKGPYISMVNEGIKVIYLNKQKIFFSIPALYRTLKNHKIEALYSTLIKPNLVAIIVGKLAGIKVVIRVANTIKEYQKSKKSVTDKFSAFLTKYLFKHAYKCIAISKIVKADLLTYTNIKDKQVEVIYNPLIIIDEVKDAVLEPGYFHVGLVSRLTWQKNIETIGKIVEIFANKPYKIQFHFFGEGKEQELLQKIIAKYNNTDIIKLHGFELTYFSYIKKMHIFIHLPFWEGLGNSVLEVFNSGIPMILSNVESGYSELIHADYPNIHYFDPKNNVDEIVSLIQKYINNEVSIEPNRVKLNITVKDTYEKYRALAN